MNELSISVLFLCYNDRETIPKLIKDADRIVSQYTSDYEILVIDDYSTDGSQDKLRELVSQYGKLKIILHSKNQGYGNTVIHGLKEASKEYFFYTDGDGQYSMEDFPALFNALKPDTVLVNGYKIVRNDPWYRILIGDLYNLLMKVLFHIEKVRDIDCDYRIIKREFFSDYHFYSSSGTICIELVKVIENSTDSIEEVPVHHYYREHGSSQFFNIGRLIKVAFHLIMLWIKLIPGGN